VSETIGIYKITNLVNGKVYIGQSYHIERRFIQHQYNNKKTETYFERAKKKYGINNFKFEIIMQLKDGPFTSKYLNRFEKHYIAYYKTTDRRYGYNEYEGGQARRNTIEANKKSSQARCGEKNYWYGKRTPTARRIKCIELNKEYESIKQASEDIKIKASNIIRALKDSSAKCGGYHWEYINKPHKMKTMKHNLRKEKHINKNIMPIQCIETGEVFKTKTEAAKRYKINRMSIHRNINLGEELKKIKLSFCYYSPHSTTRDDT